MTNKNGLSASHLSSDISLNLNGMSQQWLDLLTDLDRGTAVAASGSSASPQARELEPVPAEPSPQLVASDPGSGPSDFAWQEDRPAPPTPGQRRLLAFGVTAALSLSAVLGTALQHYTTPSASMAPPAHTAVAVQIPSAAPPIAARSAVVLPEPAPRPLDREEEAEGPRGGLQWQLNEARDLLQRGERDQAEQRFLQLLKTHHRSPTVRARLGECALFAGKVEEAIVRFEEALQLRPGHAGGLYGMAMAYKADGNKERALYWFRRYQQQQPEGKKLPRVQREIAALEEQLNDAERAEVERKLLAPF